MAKGKQKKKAADVQQLVEVKLTVRQIAERAKQLADRVVELEKVEDDYRHKRGDFNKKIKGLRGEIQRLSEEVTNGYELREQDPLPGMSD